MVMKRQMNRRKAYGVAAILVPGMLATVALTSGQVGVPISDVEAAGLRGGCTAPLSNTCRGCSGSYWSSVSTNDPEATTEPDTANSKTCCDSSCYKQTVACGTG